MKPAYLIGAVLVAVVIIGLLSFDPFNWLGEPDTPPAVPAAPQDVQTPAPAPEPEPEPESDVAPPPPLPPLDESDVEVRAYLEPYALPEAWLGQEALLRRLAVLVDNAPRGDYPRSQLRFLAPATAFKAERAGSGFRLNPASYDRYDPLVDHALSVPPPALAAFLNRYGPLLGDGLAELGNRTPWREQLGAGIRELLAVPVLPDGGAVALKRPKVLYVYADPALEGLSDLQKQLLRAGPDNVARVQAYLRELADHLGLALEETAAGSTSE